MKVVRRLMVALVVLPLPCGGCQPRWQNEPKTPAPTARAEPDATVAHVVVAWLKKPGDAATRAAVIRSAEQLRSIPGVVDVRAGEVIPSDREVVDSTYDVGLLVTFKDEAALRAYGPHPAHQKVVEEVIKPHVERFRVYDFRIAK